MRMIQRSNRAGFALESSAQILPRGDVFRQDLDGDRAVEASVAGLVDFAHSSSADRGEHLVGAESVAGGERHIRDRAQFIPLNVISPGSPALLANRDARAALSLVRIFGFRARAQIGPVMPKITSQSV